MKIHGVLESWENLTVEERAAAKADAKAEMLNHAGEWVAPKVEAVENGLNATHSLLEQGV